ncbi:MAG: hypothetical protein PHV93_00610 [Candidatus Pacebacteria bacterium]|nr:hypothetical protein [Candidatus Paceibacterota bacterium]
METKDPKAAFHWIIGILQKHKVPFQIEGGLAARAYGSKRELADIDIVFPDDRFDELLPELKKYITFGPARDKDEAWAYTLMTLEHSGQKIDIAGSSGQEYFDKTRKQWIPYSSDFSDCEYREIYGLKVPVISKKKLIAYKMKLGREVDLEDIQFLTGKDVK